jgi:uncharacterized repeat protein (TIGR01451 family)
MKKRTGLTIAIALLSSLCIFTQAYATQRDAFTFYIPYPTDSLAQFFIGPGSATVDGIENIIGISVLRDGSLIYYDEWEDGLEPNLFFPTQASTQVWGDGDTSNGVAPTVRQPNPDDRLFAGDVIALRNVVPVPRNRADLFFDGGDKISSVGGAIAVTLAAWPTSSPGIRFAGAWELYPTSRWDPNYVIPVGENVPRPQDGFRIVSLNVQADHDGTLVDVDLNGDGDFNDPGEVTDYMLDEGAQLTRVQGVNAGAQVRASAPVQVHIFTKDPTSTWEARAYTMLPRDQWGYDYVAPRSSDGDYWLYNPDTADLEVVVQTDAGSETITIPASSAGRYPPLPAPVLTSRTGARFTSADRRPFYGVAALDANEDQDWGYALLPVDNLTTQALVGWAPGNNCNPPGPCDGGTGLESRVYVTALVTTTVYVDYESNGGRMGSFDVSPLEERDIVDDVDFDMTGARLYTNDGEPFIAVWGQDESATLALPSLDLGTNIVPLRAPSIQKSYTLIEEGYNCGPEPPGNTVQFRLQAFNDSSVPIPDAIVSDTLPAGVSYVPGSTTRDGSPVPDDSSGTPFPLDEEGLAIGDLPGLGVITITYDAVIQEYRRTFTNQAEFVSPSADPASIDVTLPFRVVGYDVGKTLIDPSGGVITPGQVITFDLTITNTGNVTITTLPLRDTYDGNYLTFRSASVTPDSVVPGEIRWNDLTLALNDLPPTTTVQVSLSFDVVDTIPSDVISTTNVALAEGVQDSAGRTQAIMCGDASVSFAVPTSTNTPTPTSTSTPTPTSTSTPTSHTSTPTSRTATPTSRTATPTPTTAISTPTATPTPPVLFLPETGVGYSSSVPWWPLVLLPGLGLLVGWAVYRQRRR